MQITPEKTEGNIRPAITTVALVLYIAFVQIIEVAYAASEVAPPAAFDLLNPISFLGLLCWWLQKDSVRTGVSWPLDLGMFLYVGWILVLPYHLVKTRGVRGLVGICIFVGVIAAIWVLAILAFLALTGDTQY
jgi:hypothetical protein